MSLPDTPSNGEIEENWVTVDHHGYDLLLSPDLADRKIVDVHADGRYVIVEGGSRGEYLNLQPDGKKFRVSRFATPLFRGDCCSPSFDGKTIIVTGLIGGSYSIAGFQYVPRNPVTGDIPVNKPLAAKKVDQILEA